ncbi:hypothetical protein GUJ93_ZPchr0007g5097 [Zizania palustris]|uniref:EF-hand domain-containing protein n=1 Tax=Zizania palustris TaxID=103762 RepID=A0A8J5W669_ZIZPA|nr:hypothetical protein GUJ93_ZPchr0007g5097 [Zizania palustris]
MSTRALVTAYRGLNYGEQEHHQTKPVGVEELKRWLMQFDTDGDGRISQRELREAIRRRGAWFPGLRAWRAVHRADRNRNGFVDDDEIESLIDMAEKDLGFKIHRDPAAGPAGRAFH